jgi:ATP-dependent helicase HrpA
MPGPVEIVRGATRQRLFPGIADEGGSVACRLYATAGAAAAATRRGVLRLFVLALPQQYRELVRQARGDRELVLLGRELAAEGDLAEEAARAAFAAVFLPDDTAPPRDAASFRARLDAGRATVIEAGEGLIALLREVLALRARIQQRLGAGLGGPGAAPASADIDRQLASLVYAGFVRDIAPGRLAQLPRYLRAILVRIERLAQGRGEARQMLELAPHCERLATAAREWSSPDAAAAWEGYRWMVEEFRVSLFAQQLGTAGKVSHARLEEQWARVQRLEAGMAVPN